MENGVQKPRSGHWVHSLDQVCSWFLGSPSSPLSLCLSLCIKYQITMIAPVPFQHRGYSSFCCSHVYNSLTQQWGQPGSYYPQTIYLVAPCPCVFLTSSTLISQGNGREIVFFLIKKKGKRKNVRIPYSFYALQHLFSWQIIMFSCVQMSWKQVYNG